MEKELKKPICPYCEKEMTPTKYTGYYDSFDYWDCECENLKTEQSWNGGYVG